MNLLDLLEALLSGIGPVERDYTTKEVGNKVELCSVHDLNYFIDVDTEEQLTTKLQSLSDEVREHFTCQPMVVIATNIDKTYKCGHCSVDHHHDLMVYVPKLGKRFFASSDGLKHV